jgi:hypothetical protein
VIAAAQEARQNVRLEVFDPAPHTELDLEQQQEPSTKIVERPRINVEKPKRREIIP